MGEKNTFVRIAAVAAGSAAIAAFVTVFAVEALAGRDKETPIRLRPNASGTCVLLSKEMAVPVKKGRKVIWKIENQCKTDQTVTLGNFREPSITTSPSTCENAKIGDAKWPFQEAEDREDRQKTVPAEKSRDLKLTAVVEGTYDFDICMGSENGTKVDPRLIIDP